MKQITRFFDVETEKEAREAVKAEVKNFSWLNLADKAVIVAEATFEKYNTKYGPLFITKFMNDVV